MLKSLHINDQAYFFYIFSERCKFLLGLKKLSFNFKKFQLQDMDMKLGVHILLCTNNRRK